MKLSKSHRTPAIGGDTETVFWLDGVYLGSVMAPYSAHAEVFGRLPPPLIRMRMNTSPIEVSQEDWDAAALQGGGILIGC